MPEYESDSDKPRYKWEIILDELRRRIQAGEDNYQPGQQIPSRTELCAEFQVSDPTLGTALRELKREGLIRSLNGVGSFVRRPRPR